MPLLTMSRNLKKGYYVSGQFVAEGSELDLELKRELKGSDEPSRTDLKRESTELQKIGEDLLTLRSPFMDRLVLPEKLRDAVVDAKRITNFEGKRRQMQFIGKLMRKLDAAELDSVRAALAEQHSGSASETLATRWGFRDLLETGAAGVVMLDLSWCGGLSEARKIASMAEAWHLPVAPHDCTGPVVLCASTHL